jgi:hypothetical protein
MIKERMLWKDCGDGCVLPNAFVNFDCLFDPVKSTTSWGLGRRPAGYGPTGRPI